MTGGPGRRGASTTLIYPELTPVPAEGADRLRRRWARVSLAGGVLCDALIEYRKASEARARAILLGVLSEGRPASDLANFVRAANSDLSLKTGREVGNRFGPAFLLHLPQMAWLPADSTTVAGWLAAEKPDRPDAARLLGAARTQGVFNFLTLALYILQPGQYYPWIRRNDLAVRDVLGQARCSPGLNIQPYLSFCAMLRSVATQLEFVPQVLDYLLFDLEEKSDRGETANAGVEIPAAAPATRAFAGRRRREARFGASDLWFEGRPGPEAEGSSEADRTKSFGSPCEGRRPESFDGAARPGDLRQTLVGYRALSRNSEGRYADFLREGAGCRQCAKDQLPAHQQPIPLLCGSHDFTEPIERLEDRLVAAHNGLTTFRRTEEDGRGSLRFNPDDPTAVPELASFLDRYGLKGLSIGQCGWSDLTMRVRAEDMAHGVRLLVLGNDWYPLSQCANFLADRYAPAQSTMGAFVQRVLKLERRPKPDQVEDFVREQRAYFGNALLCYRTGWDTNGPINLSFRSFENCRDHMARHIDALRPEVLVTFGERSCAAVSGVLQGVSPEARTALSALRAVVTARVSLASVMREFYSGHSAPAGLDATLTLNGRGLTYIPLYHPSWSHKNKYDGDYDSLRRALRIA